MTTKVKKIKAKTGFHGTTDADVLKQLNTVHDGIRGPVITKHGFDLLYFCCHTILQF